MVSFVRSKRGAGQASRGGPSGQDSGAFQQNGALEGLSVVSFFDTYWIRSVFTVTEYVCDQ